MRAQKFEPVAGTAAALFFGSLAWTGVQYIQSLLRRSGVLHTASLGNVKTILDIVQWVVIILMVGLVYMIWQRHHWKGLGRRTTTTDGIEEWQLLFSFFANFDIFISSAGNLTH